jgi:hypothetical protein
MKLSVLRAKRSAAAPSKGTFTGSCPIREHTADGAFVGRCEHACYDGICPRHGTLSSYTNDDDREIDPQDRVFPHGRPRA